MNFELAGIVVPILAELEFSQTYEPIGGSVIHRMQSGKAVKQTHYTKWRTTLSGQGWLPAGLDGIDYSELHTLKCAAPRSIASTNHQLTLPTHRRTDEGFEPKGYALVNGYLVEVKLTLKADVALLESHFDAKGYCVHYYPEWTVFAELTQTQTNLSSAEFSWTINAEQV